MLLQSLKLHAVLTLTIMVWAFVSVRMDITSQAEYVQLEPHVVPTQIVILLESVCAHLDLPTTVETA